MNSELAGLSSPPVGQEATSYLFTELGGKNYAVAIEAVSEVLSLPAITPLHHAPPDFSGLVYLRDQFVPVLNLAQCLNLPTATEQNGEALVILEHNGHRVGIGVDNVLDVRPIAPADIQAVTPLETAPSSGCLRAIARSNGENVYLLGLEAIFARAAFYHANTALQLHTSQSQTPAEDQTSTATMAVVGLNGELFGVEVKWVREFAPLRSVTPVPYCPDSVIGLMNLRGEILTLIDVSATLHLTRQTPQAQESYVVVINYEDWVVGVLIDEVVDIFAMSPQEVDVATNLENDEPLRGTTWYGEKILGVLDVPRLLQQERRRLEERI